MNYVTDKFDEKVVQLLNSGGVGFMPSDTIYGLSCRALDGAAIDKLTQLKQRDQTKAFIVLISDIKMLDLLSIDKKQVAAAEKYWPGPLTLICKTNDSSPWLPKIDGTLAVRIPAQEDLLRLISQTGPLVSTSANLGGEAPVKNLQEAQTVFGDKLDFYVDQGEITGQPSTLARNNNGKLEVLRPGAVKIDS